ncbi:DGQHR domain-containing protein [Inquilinus limosus]|uniref:DGQHR domain-containing protein n=1 Tax=Inquilinus limosus TaxID=171674 RepID=UPI003F1484A0
MDTITFTGLRVSQPVGEFYVGVIDACVLMRMARADVRRITERDFETYSGIQRGLNRARVSEINDFIKTADAAFPNTIILNVDSGAITEIKEQSSQNGSDRSIVQFEISGGENTFKIIDGQHRLAGFDENNCLNFDLVVTLFVDLILEEQAYLFSTINLKQTKVNKSLVYDLFDVAETKSPQKIAHSVVKMLNADDESPFYKRIKLLGVTPIFEGKPLYLPTLTQGTVVDRLLRLISREPAKDRDREKRGERIELTGREVIDGLIFRPPYVEDQEWAIYRVMLNYFGAIARSFEKEWSDPKNPLSRTIGYGALMRLLVPLYQRGYMKQDVSSGYFLEATNEAAKRHRTSGMQITFDNFPAAGNGETKLADYLLDLCELR